MIVRNWAVILKFFSTFWFKLSYFVRIQKLYIIGLNDCRTTGKGGGKTNTECIFPFIYKDKRYQKCVWSEGESEPWCSTKVTKHGFHVGGQGEWGYCNSNCPISPKPGKSVTLWYHEYELTF